MHGRHGTADSETRGDPCVECEQRGCEAVLAVPVLIGLRLRYGLAAAEAVAKLCNNLRKILEFSLLPCFPQRMMMAVPVVGIGR